MANINTKSAGLISLFVVPVAAAGVYLFNQPRPSPAYAVCLIAPLGFADGEASGCYTSSQVNALFLRPVSLGKNPGQEGVTMSSPSANIPGRAVRTCRDYDTAVQEGLVALTTFDISMESFFKKTCGTLKAIAGAKPAQQSFLATPQLSISDLNVLSASAISLITEAQPPGRTVGDLVEAGTIKVTRRGEASLDIQAGSNTGTLQELARGDFNGDGLEDILAFESVHAEDGSLRAFQTEILTRRSADGPIEVTR